MKAIIKIVDHQIFYKRFYLFLINRFHGIARIRFEHVFAYCKYILWQAAHFIIPIHIQQSKHDYIVIQVHRYTVKHKQPTMHAPTSEHSLDNQIFKFC